MGLIELEEVATLLLIPAEDLRSALLYRTMTLPGSSTTAVDPATGMVHGTGGMSTASSFVSRESTLGRGGDTSASRNFIPNHHHQRASVVSNTTSLPGRGGHITFR